MSRLLVFVLCTEAEVDQMITEIQSLKDQQLITIMDAASVARRLDDSVMIKQADSLTGTDALGGPFWGMLIGMLIFLPWLGVPVNTITRSLNSKYSGWGLTDSFIKEVGASIMPGYSALFLLITTMKEDRIIEAVSRHKATLLQKSLSSDDESKLRMAFGAAGKDG